MVEVISQEQNEADTRVTVIELLNVGFINDSTLSQDGDAFDPGADIIERTKTEYSDQLELRQPTIGQRFG